MKRRTKTLTTAITAVTVAMATVGFAGCRQVMKYADAERYLVGNATFLASQVREIDVDWIGGGIEIVNTTAQEVQIGEENRSDKEADQMHYFLDGDILRVKYCRSGYNQNISDHYKTLHIALPAGKELDIDCVSASVTMTGAVELTELFIESVSGNINVESAQCARAEIETTSGQITIGSLTTTGKTSLDTVSGNIAVERLSAAKLEAETTSGNLSFGVCKAVDAEVESTSGEVTFILKEGLGAVVDFSSGKGDYYCSKPQRKEHGKSYVYGDDGSTACRLKIDTISGDCRIE